MVERKQSYLWIAMVAACGFIVLAGVGGFITVPHEYNG
jgi:hypothetical protein